MVESGETNVVGAHFVRITIHLSFLDALQRDLDVTDAARLKPTTVDTDREKSTEREEL